MTDKPSHSRYRRALREEAERERRLALFDEMLEALKLASSIIGHPDDSVSQSIVELIAKAEGKS